MLLQPYWECYFNASNEDSDILNAKVIVSSDVPLTTSGLYSIVKIIIFDIFNIMLSNTVNLLAYYLSSAAFKDFYIILKYIIHLENN